jgi:hypothetical protein
MSDHAASDLAGKLKNWQIGIEDFNAGNYWKAHESWEKGWLMLAPLDKLHLQILIQAAGVLHLVEKGRLRGARALLDLALSKFEKIKAAGGIDGTYPRVEIDGLESFLSGWASSWPAMPGQISQKSLQARLLLSPP